MAEMLAATLALPEAPLVLPDVTLALAPPARRFSLRARDAQALGRATGLALPDRIGDYRDGVAKLGPDEWFALSNPPPEGEDFAAYSVVDVSSRSVGISVSGVGAAALVASGCPLDIERMAPGRATRTLYETVEIVLIRTDEERFCIEVWRSFAPWLFAALAAAASGSRQS